ncbi:Protein of unknown function, partial [Gryllus bimaculatus]
NLILKVTENRKLGKPWTNEGTCHCELYFRTCGIVQSSCAISMLFHEHCGHVKCKSWRSADVLRDTMSNTRFQNAVKNIKSEESLFYGQFIMDEKEERKLVAFQNHVIPRNIMAKIIRDIIFEIFLEEYNLHY